MHPIENLRYVARAQGVPSVDLVRETAMSLDWLGATGPDLVIACRRILERQPVVGRLWWMAASLMASAGSDGFSSGVRTSSDDLIDALDRDPTARVLADAITDDATVVTIGRPDTVGDALARRGDVRVLCADSQHEASSFLRRLERSDVEAEPVPGEYLARAVSIADLVVIEALAASDRTIVAPVGSQVLAAVAAQLGRPIWIVAPLGTRLPHQYVAVIASLIDDAGSVWEVDIDAFASDLATQVVTAAGVVDADAPGAFASDCPYLPELVARRSDGGGRPVRGG